MCAPDEHSGHFEYHPKCIPCVFESLLSTPYTEDARTMLVELAALRERRRHGAAGVRTCAHADEELDRLSRENTRLRTDAERLARDLEAFARESDAAAAYLELGGEATPAAVARGDAKGQRAALAGVRALLRTSDNTANRQPGTAAAVRMSDIPYKDGQ